MKKRLVALLSVALLSAVSIFLQGPVVAQDALPTFDELSEGWNIIAPGGETTCGFGDPYRFFVRPGTENKLLINFEGSANCLDSESCRADVSTNPYIYSVPDDDWRGYIGDAEATDFRENEGILQTDFVDNPFQNYTIAVLPACTFDSHLGDKVVTYGTGDDAYTVNFKGYVNATAALDWVYANVEAPESVMSISCDSGSAGHIPNIIAHYDGIPFTQIGDSIARFRDDYSFLFDQWGTMEALADVTPLEGIAPSDLTVISAYIAQAALTPAARFATVDTANDAEQADFLGNLEPSLEELRAGIPGFRSYVGWGEGDCVMVKPDFYTHQTNGVRLRDWVAALAAGETVEDVQCTDCETPEIYEG